MSNASAMGPCRAQHPLAIFLVRLLFRRILLRAGKGGFRLRNPPCVRLETCDVGCLQALRAAGNLEFNSLTLIQRLVAVCLNRREVDENIFARLPLNEPISLAGIEPLHSSLFSHFFVLHFLQKLFALLVRLQPQRRQDLLRKP